MKPADVYIISVQKLEDVLRIQMDVSLGLYVTFVCIYVVSHEISTDLYSQRDV